MVKPLRRFVKFDMNIEEMSLESLEIYLIVLNYIRKKAELSGCFDYLCLGNENTTGKDIEGVEYDDYYKIFWTLIHNEVFQPHYADNNNLFLNINKEVFYKLCSDVENRIKFLKGDPITEIKILRFDPENSILAINDYKIKISRQKNENYAHSILKIIFETGVDQQFFYSELLEDILGASTNSKGKDLWRTIHRACEDIQQKVLEGTSYRISDFLDCSTGKKGSVKINSKYLPH